MSATRYVPIAIAAALASALLLPATAIAQHAGHGDHAAPAAQESGAHAPAVRYASDAPLRKGMGEIRGAVAALDHNEHGHMNQQQALATVGIIERSIGDIVANCKLEPTPDTALHGVLARMMQASQALHASPADLAPLHELDAALTNYERMFDDPNHAAG